MRSYRILISGGGTGGHIFPAIAIADTFRQRFPESEILFVGADSRMEMERVPAAGYQIVGLPVSGFDRSRKLKNISVLFQLFKSLRMAKKLLREYRPDIVVGVGGYASAPTLRAASSLRIPTLIQEQNSCAGITNKWLGKRVDSVCVAYEGMERFFPARKIVLTGNPVRQELEESVEEREKALDYFQLSTGKKTVLVLGGSLGARTINNGLSNGLDRLLDAGIQVIWQTGRIYCDAVQRRLKGKDTRNLLWYSDFISRMDYAYAAADLVVSRAGAGSVSECCLLKKPVILIPSPNVAEDHQTKNAQAVADKGAAVILADREAETQLVDYILSLVHDTERLRVLGERMALLAQPRSAELIVNEMVKLMCPGIPASRRDDSASQCKIMPHKVYFIGAGGIGMSALIRYFRSKGIDVAGYDRTPSALTEQLMQEGIDLHFTDDLRLIPPGFMSPEATWVIYTPAVPESHAELTYFRTQGYKVLKRSRALGLITRSERGLCIAGTHGKTTTSSMTAYLLQQSSVGCNAFLGGILKNTGSNLMLSGHSDLTVIEADEYDRSFHQLSPWMAVITYVDPDHLDIYGTAEAYRESFEIFTSLIRPGGALILKSGLDLTPRLQAGVKSYTYSASDEKADFHAENIRIGNGEIRFNWVAPSARVEDIQLGVPVKINVENAVAAIALAWLNGVSGDEIRMAMKSYAGVERRFEICLKKENIVMIDDYAHHPEELKNSILSVKELYAGRKVTGIFQPHLYTRTRDFAADFAESLSLLDELILLDIYPAREEPIPGVTSQLIFDRVTIPEKTLCTKAQLPELIAAGTYEVVLTLGAGDIDRLVEPVKQILERK
jgi:UDP-N-acetylmuramate--alanine ligase